MTGDKTDNLIQTQNVGLVTDDGGDVRRTSGGSLPNRNAAFAAADRATLAGMAVGLGVMLQPWWSEGLRVGFFVTLVATLAQTVFGRLRPGAPP